jgi:hypothetical protein
MHTTILMAIWLKCNVDCGIFSIEEKFDISIYFYNSSNSIVQAHIMVIPFVALAIECETTACSLESDCEHVNVVNNCCTYL